MFVLVMDHKPLGKRCFKEDDPVRGGHSDTDIKSDCLGSEEGSEWLNLIVQRIAKGWET